MIENIKDIDMTFDGDLIFEGDDVKTISDLELIKKEILRYLESEPNDFKLYRDIGFPVHNYIGMENTRSNGKNLEKEIKSSILKHLGYIVDVRVIPTSHEEITILLSFDFIGYETEQLVFNFNVIKGFIYHDFDFDKDVLLSTADKKINSEKNKSHPKIWDKIRTQ